MRRLAHAFLLCVMVPLSAKVASAQAGPAPDGARRGAPGAEFFLARTGELRLTDAQVVRLAAIARRSAERRRAMRASLDSIAAARRGPRPDSAERAARFRERDQLRTRFDRERQLAQSDLRDALAVLTADQQVAAWEMAARGSRRPRAAGGARFRRGRDEGRRRLDEQTTRREYRQRLPR